MSLRDKIDGMRSSLRAGVVPVSAHCLFPTPDDVADRMVEAAELPELAPTVLEPSAGTGQLVRAVGRACPSAWVVPVEQNPELARRLNCWTQCTGDFLTMHPDDMPDCLPSYFDRVLMNPPFDHGSDIRHILHARHFLSSQGVLVALCADGPRQAEALSEFEWLEHLPPGTFEGTSVRTAMIRWRA